MSAELAATKSATHLALLRGVNVGGKNVLPMKVLAQMFVDCGCSDVRTYIQSGNVVFAAPASLAEKIPTEIARRINHQFGLSVPLVMRSAGEVGATICHNPYLAAPRVHGSDLDSVADPKTLHVMFLADQPKASAIASLDPARSLPDAFTVLGRDIYLRLPNGAAKSRLTNAYFDSRLATTSTQRNWATVLKLAEWMSIDKPSSQCSRGWE